MLRRALVAPRRPISPLPTHDDLQNPTPPFTMTIVRLTASSRPMLCGGDQKALCIARSPETPLVLTEACLQPPTLACPETAKELRGSAPENPP
jgi:hypothetical protein